MYYPGVIPTFDPYVYLDQFARERHEARVDALPAREVSIDPTPVLEVLEPELPWDHPDHPRWDDMRHEQDVERQTAGNDDAF